MPCGLDPNCSGVRHGEAQVHACTKQRQRTAQAVLPACYDTSKRNPSGTLHADAALGPHLSQMRHAQPMHRGPSSKYHL